MKEKGFTLIELLAVIIILSIIALIAVPVVSNIIASTRVKAAETTTLAVLRAAKIYYGNEEISGTFRGAKFKCDGSSCKKCTNATCSTTDANTILKFEGTVPDSGIIEISNDGNAYIVTILYYAENKVYVGYDSNDKIKASKVDSDINPKDTELYAES